MDFIDALAEANIRGDYSSAVEPNPLEPYLWKTDENGYSEAGRNVWKFMNHPSVIAQTGRKFPRKDAETLIAQAVARNTTGAPLAA